MDMKELRAALAIIKDSEQLIMSLKVSIGSPSPALGSIENGVVPYLRTKKRSLKIKLFLFTFRAIWLKIFKCRNPPRIW
jgi:hypothetical protein